MHSEAHILLSIHNLLLARNEVTLEISQEKLAEYLEIGERTVQRITKRLVKMGRLNRMQGQGRSHYIYSIPPNAIDNLMMEILIKGNLYIFYAPDGSLSLVRDFEDIWKLAGGDSTEEK